MTDLTHDQVHEMVQQTYLSLEDRRSLQRHLATCEACREYAAWHVRLLRELPQPATRLQPTTEQRGAILAAAGRGKTRRPAARPSFPQGLVSLGGLAAVTLVIVAAWLLVRSGQQAEIQSPPVGPWATVLAPFRREPAAVETGTPSPQAPAVVVDPEPNRTPDPRGRYELVTVPAPSLAGNAIGEPVDQPVAVYLPPSYDTSDRRYPVVYAMFSAIEIKEPDQAIDLVGRTARSAMNLTLREGAPEMILVMPSPVNVYGLTNFFADSPVTGDWATFVADDLVSYVDDHYRTIPAAESRGILGEDYLALGALTVAARHPDVFSALYLLQPLVFIPGDAMEDRPMLSRLARPMILDWISETRALPPGSNAATVQERFALISKLQVSLSDAVAYGLAFAPNVAAGPPYFDYPYSEADGLPDPAVMQRWEQGLGDIPAKLAPLGPALRGLDISIGVHEGHPRLPSESGLYLGEQLTQLGAAVRQVQTVNGVGGIGQEALPWLAETLASD